MEDSENVVKQIFHTRAKTVEIASRRPRKIGEACATVVVSDAVIVKPRWKPISAPLNQMSSADMLCETRLRFRRALPQVLGGRQPHVPLEHMGPVVCALLVKQFRFRLPIEPAIVERPVGETDETAFGRPAARDQRIADCSGIKSRRGLHHARIAARNLFMTHICIEVIGDPRLEPVQIDIDEKSVAAGLNPWKRRWQ